MGPHVVTIEACGPPHPPHPPPPCMRSQREARGGSWGARSFCYVKSAENKFLLLLTKLLLLLLLLLHYPLPPSNQIAVGAPAKQGVLNIPCAGVLGLLIAICPCRGGKCFFLLHESPSTSSSIIILPPPRNTQPACFAHVPRTPHTPLHPVLGGNAVPCRRCDDLCLSTRAIYGFLFTEDISKSVASHCHSICNRYICNGSGHHCRNDERVDNDLDPFPADFTEQGFRRWLNAPLALPHISTPRRSQDDINFLLSIPLQRAYTAAPRTFLWSSTSLALHITPERPCSQAQHQPLTPMHSFRLFGMTTTLKSSVRRPAVPLSFLLLPARTMPCCCRRSPLLPPSTASAWASFTPLSCPSLLHLFRPAPQHLSSVSYIAHSQRRPSSLQSSSHSSPRPHRIA